MSGERVFRGGEDLETVARRLREYFDAIVRARWALGAWLAACLAVGVAYAELTPGQFIAHADVEIGPRAIANDGPEDVRHFHQIDIDGEQAETELWVMRSDRVTRRVFDALNLAETRELTSGSEGLLPFIAHVLHVLVAGRGSYDARDRAFLAFKSRITLLRVGGSYVYEMRYRSHDPNLAARVANGLASAYLSDRIERELQRQATLGGQYKIARREALLRELLDSRAQVERGLAPPEDLYAADARVLSAAVPPLHKTFPKLAPTLMLCAAISLVAGAAAILYSAGSPIRRLNGRPTPASN